MKSERWFSITLLLAGLLLGGVVGNWSGSAEARNVEQALTERIDREIGYVREQLREIKEILREGEQ